MTAELPGGRWTSPQCGSQRAADLPAGDLKSIVHTHPGQSSLSRVDLTLLRDRPSLQRVVVVTRGAEYEVSRGRQFADLDMVYGAVAREVSSVLAERRGSTGFVLSRDRDHEINLRLARREIIAYTVRAPRKEGTE